MNSTMCTALLTLLSMTLFAGNSVLCRLALLEYKMEPVTYTAVRLISGALMLWLIMAVRHKNVFKSGTWPGALASASGYVIWYMVVVRFTVTVAAVVQLSVPVITAIGGVLFVNEPITLRVALSSAAILGGIFFATAFRRG